MLKQSSCSSESSEVRTLDFASFERALSGWFISGRINGWSERTLTDRQEWMHRLAAFLQARDMPFSTDAIRLWLLALQEGKEERCRKPLRPASLDHVQRLLRAFCQWCVDEGLLSVHAMKRIPPPIVRDDHVRTLTDDQVQALLAAAKKSRNGKRDYAIVATLLDAALRASELCSIRVRDLDLLRATVMVEHGKGGKTRMVPIGRTAVKALFDYLRSEERADTDFVFLTERGEPMTRNTVRLIMERLSERTGIHVCAHRLRHTAAVMFLRNGASAYHTMRFLGHTTLTTTKRYARLVDADVAEVHRSASPLDRLRARGSKNGKKGEK